MGDHLVLHVHHLVKPKPVGPEPAAAAVSESSKEGGATHRRAASGTGTLLSPPGCSLGGERKVEIDMTEEVEPLIKTVECRICQEEDIFKNLDAPCACSGSLKYAHRACIQRWINEKGDLTCEICHEPYKSGYVVPPRIFPYETAIDISGNWATLRTPLELHDPRLSAMAAAQHHFIEAEYDEYAARNASGAAFCRSAAVILMALLLMRRALTITSSEEEDDASTFFSLFLLRAAGFLLPCYVMAWAISVLQRRRQRQEAAELAANEVAFILRSGGARRLRSSFAPGSPATRQEPHR